MRPEKKDERYLLWISKGMMGAREVKVKVGAKHRSAIIRCSRTDLHISL